MCTGFVKTYQGLLVVRFFLGLCEGGMLGQLPSNLAGLTLNADCPSRRNDHLPGNVLPPEAAYEENRLLLLCR